MELYFDSECRIGRFQYVTTDRAYRRNGICPALLDAVSKNAFQEVGVSELVIYSGESDTNPARPVYTSFGFTNGVNHTV